MDSIKFLIATVNIILGFILDIAFFYLIRIYFDIMIMGTYGFILSFLMMFNFIVDLGFGLAHIKLSSEAISENERGICNGTFIYIKIFQILIYVFIILTLIPIFHLDTQENIVIYIFLLSNVFLKFSFLAKPIFLSEKKVLKSFLPHIIGSVIRIALLLILNKIFVRNIWYLAFIIFIADFSVLVSNLFLLRKTKIKQPNGKYINKYLKFAYPFFFISTFVVISKYIDILLVNQWYSLKDVANYYSAKEIYHIFFTILLSLNNIFIATFTKNFMSGDFEKNLLLIKRIHKFLNILVIPIVFLTILYSTEILVYLFGKEYILTGIILSILILSLIPISLDCAISIHLKALNKVEIVAIITVLESILSIILIFFFMSPDFLNLGPIGGAYALLLAKIIVISISRPIIYVKYKIGFYWGSFRNLALMLGLTFLQLIINNFFSYPIILIPIFMIFNICLYFLLNYILKGITKEDIKFIKSIINLKNIKQTVYLEFE